MIDLAIMLSYLYICGGRLPGLYEPLIPIDKPTRYDEGAMLYLDKLEYVQRQAYVVIFTAGCSFEEKNVNIHYHQKSILIYDLLSNVQFIELIKPRGGHSLSECGTYGRPDR